MKYVLDASVFFSDLSLEGELYTTPLILGELKDLRSKGRFEALAASGMIVTEPLPVDVGTVRDAASGSGDLTVISQADTEVLALAYSLGAILVTDDFAVQNVADRLGVAVLPVAQRKAKPRRYTFRCTGCGRYAKDPGICEVCGSELKRKLK